MDIDVKAYCDKAQELYEKFCDCYTTEQVTAVIDDQLSRMQANKISVKGNLFFIPNQYLPLLNILEDYIESLAKYNLNDDCTIVCNSMHVVDSERKREKMAEEFYNNYKRDIELYQKSIQKFMVKPKEVFVDATHVKACANNKKVTTEIVKQESLFYEEQLEKEINFDRKKHGKKPLKDKKDDDDNNNGKSSSGGTFKEEKCSTSDPESGWFYKGEHKQVFAYSVETACDKHGWILGYTVNKGNLHDIRTFKGLYDKIKNPEIETIIADAGYGTPAIAKLLLDDGIKPLLPYKRPQTKKGYFKKYDYAYDEYFDCYICPNNKILKYSTTNREGYREYKSCPQDCEKCPYLSQCTESQNHTKVVTQHI